MFDSGLVTDDIMERPKINITANGIIVLNVNNDAINEGATITDVVILKKGVMTPTQVKINMVRNAIMEYFYVFR